MADITDGTSNTYLVGEKYLDPDYYTTGQDLGTTNPPDGRQRRLLRRVDRPANPLARMYSPRPDTPGSSTASPGRFGSAHLAGFQMSFCDGSVRMMSYSIDQETHRRLTNRKDGLTIHGEELLQPRRLR